MVSPSARRRAVDHVQQKLAVSQRRACGVLRQARATQRYQRRTTEREQQLRQWLQRFATAYPRYGYRRAHAGLRADGWAVNRKCVERLWRAEGLRVPARRQKRSRITGVRSERLAAEHPNHVWSYDFVADRTSDGRQLRLLTIIDEYTRESLAIVVRRSMTARDVITVLAGIADKRGIPTHIRSDNGPEFIATAVKEWLKASGITTLYIDPGAPWQNGSIESFNGKLRDELLSMEVFDSLAETIVLVEEYRQHYNHQRPHSALGNLPPAVFVRQYAASQLNNTLITSGT
jgi:transposase InsO family protein